MTLNELWEMAEWVRRIERVQGRHSWRTVSMVDEDGLERVWLRDRDVVFCCDHLDNGDKITREYFLSEPRDDRARPFGRCFITKAFGSLFAEPDSVYTYPK